MVVPQYHPYGRFLILLPVNFAVLLLILSADISVSKILSADISVSKILSADIPVSKILSI
jgi:hypothetical protein